MFRWTLVLVLLITLLAAACAPAATLTPTPIPKVPASTAVPAKAAPTTQSPAGTPKPAAATPTAPPKAAVKPLDPPVTVKVGGTGSLTEGFLYIADAKGYFTDEGLKAEFVRFGSATQMV
ncbi:MAG: hypothetical protein Q8R28_20580, partial [Dehalococcoidia bacterium]|nr:hypothetical protein [Dehalococcoidia bacterium]